MGARARISQRRLLALILTMVLGLVPTSFLTGCAKKVPPPVESPITEISTPMPAVEMVYRVHSEVLRDEDGTILIELKAVNPEIKNPGNSPGITRINEYYQVAVQDFYRRVQGAGKEHAVADMRVLRDADFGFQAHVYELWPKVYYNAHNLFSVFNTEYTYTGGAHPISYFSADNFRVDTGHRLDLRDVMGLSLEQSREKLYSTAIAQIKAEEGTEDFFYYEDYEQIVRRSFNAEDFLLTEGDLMFFYQYYTLYPYAGGYPVFHLPYDQRGAGAPVITPIASIEEERELYVAAGHLLDRNREIFSRIYLLSMLPLEMPEVITEGQHLFPVVDERFPTFAALEGYIRGTYSPAQADSLLGNGRYVDINGRLHGDIYKDGGMGYYTNWNDYRFALSDITYTSALLTVHTESNSPAGRENETLTVKLEKVDGYWVLERMTY